MPVLIHNGVGDDVVVVDERVQAPRGEVMERRSGPARHADHLSDGAGGGGVVLEPAQPGVVGGLDRGERR